MCRQGEVKIFNSSNITAAQVFGVLLAIPAFLPLTVCTGYLAAWFTNLHGFRHRSVVERIFWSVPLSAAVSTIAAVLIGKFLSLVAVAVLLYMCTGLWLATLFWEWIHLRRSRRRWTLGLQPLGAAMLLPAIFWTAIIALSLVDIHSNQRLLMSLTIYDHGARVNWAESILRTGIPPANPLYFYNHAANLRYYYFWLVDCAAVAKISHLSVRAVVAAGCVWAGFCLAAITGLYLKHFLEVGNRLREQFQLSIYLFAVGGLSFCVYVWNMLFLHIPAPGDVWSAGQISDWFSFFLFYPHHLVSMVCCMLAFLLAWMAVGSGFRERIVSIPFIAAALASAFGLSVYVASAFFLVVLFWSLWQFWTERNWLRAAVLAAGGAGACVLLLPYLWELSHSASKTYGGSVFVWSIRETIPPQGLLATRVFQTLAASHPGVANGLAKLILMAPGYAIELGLYFVVLLICLIPRWHSRTRLTPPQRSLIFIAAATIPITSFIRSGVISINDFGIHSALFLQYPLLLLASELLISWKYDERKLNVPVRSTGWLLSTPAWLRSLAAFAIIIGAFTTVYRALTLRFILPLSEVHASEARNTEVAYLSHKAYISYIGYAHLDAVIPRDAIVQFNSAESWVFWKNVDLININHQTAIAAGQLWCGSELGGDPAGCPAMMAAINPLFKGATAEKARAACHQYGIQYLVANIYDSAWNDKSGWVWTLNPVVSDPEFRVLDCKH